MSWELPVGVLLGWLAPSIMRRWRARSPLRRVAAGSSVELFDAVGREAEAFVRRHRVPGLSMSLAMAGEQRDIVLGVRSVGGPPVSSATVFAAGSVTKLFVAHALDDLCRAGTVRLRQPLDELPGPHREHGRCFADMTLLDLATHHSGLPRLPRDFAPGDAKDPYHGYDAERFARSFSPAVLRNLHERAYRYSNYGYALLGQVLTRVAGQELPELVARACLRPAGLSRTTMAPVGEDRAAAHRRGARVPDWTLGEFAAAGGAWSNAADLVRFALWAGAQRPEPLRRWRRAVDGTCVGLGWHVTTDGPWDIAWHDGETGGSSAYVGTVRDRGVAVAVLANAVCPLEPLGRVIATALARHVDARGGS